MALYALDIETSGLDPRSDRVLCIGIYGKDERVAFKTVDSFLAWHKESNGYILHSGSFDTGFFRTALPSILTYWSYDTQSISSILTPRPESLGLEYLSKTLLGREEYKLDRTRMEDYSWEELSAYCLADCKNTYDLFKYLVDRMDAKSWDFVEKWVMPVTKLCADMEWNGLPLDVKGIEDYRSAVRVRRDKVMDELLKLTEQGRKRWHSLQFQELKKKYDDMWQRRVDRYGDEEKATAFVTPLFEKAAEKIAPFNFNSAEQLKWLLRDYHGVNLRRKKQVVRGGVKQMVEDDFVDEAGLSRLDHPVAKAMLTYREVEKLLSTSIPNLVDNVKCDGRIHARFNVGGTRTGRLSSSGPNMQQVDAKLKQFITAGSPDTLLSVIDYAQIEVRTLAHAANEKILIEKLKEGYDPYTIVAHLFFPDVVPADCKNAKKDFKVYRNTMKTIGLAIIYGTGAGKAQEVIRNELGIKMTRDNVQRLIDRYRASMPAVQMFKNGLELQLKRGQTVYNMLGRPFTIEDPDKVYMTGLNTYNQGSASDLNLWAQAAFAIPALEKAKIPFKYLAAVHDESVYELPASEAEAITKEIIMPAITTQVEKALEFKVPLEAEYEVSRQWSKP